MKQEYHTNAVTNLHIRKQIKESSLKNIELAETFNTSVATISKWRNRQELEDKSYSGFLYNYGADVPVIRYAEVLLSYLEAVLESGQPITQSLLNETINRVRGRATVNMPPITETNPDKLREILRLERRVELALEGQRYWDLLRWKIAHEVLNGDFYGAPFPGAKNMRKKGNVTDPYSRWYVISRNFRNPEDYKWPIPQSEQDINPNLRD